MLTGWQFYFNSEIEVNRRSPIRSRKVNVASHSLAWAVRLKGAHACRSVHSEMALYQKLSIGNCHSFTRLLLF